MPPGGGAAAARAAARLRAAGRAARRRPRRTRAAPRPSRRSDASSSTSRVPIRRSPQRVVTVSPDVASSTNLGGWINHCRRVEHGRAHRLVRRRPADAHALARVLARPARRARHRRGEPGRPAGRARSDLVARGAPAPADRRALRPVRQPRARAVVVRHLRRRPVDPRRDAVGRDARAGGRGPPVGHHALGRPRAAALRGLGAGLRAGPRVDAARRAREPRTPRRQLGLLPPQHASRSTRPSRASPASRGARAAPQRTCSPAATSSARRSARPTSHWSEWARSCPTCWPRRRSSRRRVSRSTWSA